MGKAKQLKETISLPERVTITEFEEAIGALQIALGRRVFGVTQEDIEKASFLLSITPQMIGLLKDYEAAKKININGLNALEIIDAEGQAMYLDDSDDHSDVTANSVVFMDKREAVAQVYMVITRVIEAIIGNLIDEHERLIGKLLFIDGMKNKDAVNYLERGYKLFSIGETTYWDKRRRIIARAAKHLKMLGMLEYIVEREDRDVDKKNPGKPMRKKYIYGLRLPGGWEDGED